MRIVKIFLEDETIGGNIEFCMFGFESSKTYIDDVVVLRKRKIRAICALCC